MDNIEYTDARMCDEQGNVLNGTDTASTCAPKVTAEIDELTGLEIIEKENTIEKCRKKYGITLHENNDFGRSLVANFERYGRLTSRQIDAWVRYN
jgi:hypothetical protein